ncbi:hypothetical protein N7541_007165 [Penicillium brevicompactum]|uniref:Thioredoxin domain-containing protein n=1 Tax=Penicillium brevicompactum TaxID=5074 RepID=A0A9W9R2C2_PENBR|nr:hypothetical protein N7541_007165 [Penicillium brevicompactum]
MRSSTSYLLLLGAATATSVFATSKQAHSDVVDLTEETFHDFMDGHDLALANFYVPWCRWSKRLAPNFEAAATELKSDNIPLIRVDCTKEEILCSEYDIGAYPTMKVFRGSDSHEEYEGSRQTESIISFMLDESISNSAGSGLFVQTYD